MIKEQLMIQFSNQILNCNVTEYKNEYNRQVGELYGVNNIHFNELPTWILQLTAIFDINKFNCAVEVITNEEDYENVISSFTECIYLSVMEANFNQSLRLIKENPTIDFICSGYISKLDIEVLKEYDNVSWYNSMLEFCINEDLLYTTTHDYTFFYGEYCIPRLTMSINCNNHCKFCTIRKGVEAIDNISIRNNILMMRDVKFKHIYIDDKTFGQCSNYIQLHEYYDLIKRFNNEFVGFIVQTTAIEIIEIYNNSILNKIDNIFEYLHIFAVELGIESYNDDILRSVHKPHLTQHIDTAIQLLNKYNVNVIANIMLGLKGETETTFNNTIDWIKKTNLFHCNLFTYVDYTKPHSSNKIENIKAISKDSFCDMELIYDICNKKLIQNQS